MIGRLLSAVGMVAVATLLAGGGLAGYLFGSGRLNAQRLEQIAAVLRGEPAAPAAGAAASTQPAEPATQPWQGAPVTGGPRTDLESLRLERARADLDAQRRLLDQVLAHVMQQQDALAESQASLAQRRQESSGATRDEGFRKELEYVGSLKPAQAKEYLLRVWQRSKADAVRLMVAMDQGRGRRILEQFKTQEELQVMTDLLEQIRLQGDQGPAEVSGRTAGAAVP